MSSTDAIDLLEDIFDLDSWVRDQDLAGAFYNPVDEFRDLSLT